MLPGSAKRLHRSRPSCQLIQGIINTNPQRGPQALGKPISCNQSCIKLGLPALSASAPGRGCGPHAGSGSGSGSLEPAGWAALPLLPFSVTAVACGLLCLGDIFLRPLVQALPPPLSPAHSVPHTALAALGVVLISAHVSPLLPDHWGRSPHYAAEAARPGMDKPLTRGHSQKGWSGVWTQGPS